MYEGDGVGSGAPMTGKPFVRGSVRIILQDGSIMIFKPQSSSEERVTGYSDVYGSVSVPTRHIADVLLGNETFEPYEPPYSEWSGKPPVEPRFDSN
jgi:hypothetical protein